MALIDKIRLNQKLRNVVMVCGNCERIYSSESSLGCPNRMGNIEDIHVVEYDGKKYHTCENWKLDEAF